MCLTLGVLMSIMFRSGWAFDVSCYIVLYLIYLFILYSPSSSVLLHLFFFIILSYLFLPHSFHHATIQLLSFIQYVSVVLYTYLYSPSPIFRFSRLWGNRDINKVIQSSCMCFHLRFGVLCFEESVYRYRVQVFEISYAGERLLGFVLGWRWDRLGVLCLERLGVD